MKKDVDRGKQLKREDEESEDEIPMEELESFLRKLVIMYNQTREEDFGEIVRSELKTHIHLQEEEEFELAFKKFQSLFEEWWRSDDGNYFLEFQDENDPINECLEYAKTESANQLLKHRKMDIENLNLKFLPSTLTDLHETLKQYQVLLIFSAGHTTDPTAAKINQILNGDMGKHAIINIKDLVQKFDCIVIGWKRNLFDILVIEVCSVHINIDTTLVKMREVLKDSTNSSKKIVFVSTGGFYMKQLKSIKSIFRETLKEKQDSLEYRDFEPETKKLFLEKNIIFQGEGVLLSEIDIMDILDQSTVSALIGNEEPVIGVKLEIPLEYYIDRSLEIRRMVSESVLHEEEGFFALSNISLQELNNKILPGQQACSLQNWITNRNFRFILVNDSQEFENLCNEDESLTIHWLLNDKKGFLWRQSRGVLGVIQRHLDPHDVIELDPEVVFEGEDGITLLTAEPGMGKTTLMTHLAKTIKMKNRHIWVIRVDINKFTKTLAEVKNQGVEKSALEIVSVAAGIKELDKNSLETSFFKKCMREGNMVILIDGVDEVAPTFTEETNEIIKYLSCDTGISKIWVTARISMKNALEREFGVPSYSFVPFDKNDQEAFLVKYWRKKYPEMNMDFLIRSASQVRRLVTSQFKNNEMDFMGIPLQSLLLAEVAGQDLKKPTIENINMLSLYDLFVEKKWNIYLTEKMHADPTKDIVSFDSSHLYKAFIQNHKAAAVFSLLTPDEIERINGGDLETRARTFLQRVANGTEKTGIIYGVSSDGYAHFVHRTFCEYFVAKWLYDTRCHAQWWNAENFHLGLQKFHDYQMLNPVSENIIPILGKIFDSRFEVVRAILDRMFCKGFSLHTAILNGNESEFKMLTENSGSINETDDGGRTPLHLAASCGHFEFARILLNKGADVFIKDRALEMTVMSFCSQAKRWDILAEILEMKPETRDQLLTPDNVRNIHYISPILRFAVNYGHQSLLNHIMEKYGWILLHTAVQKGNFEFLELVLTAGTPIEAEDEIGNTALHVAVQSDRFDFCQFLIMKGCVVTSANHEGLSPLHVAVNRGRLDILKLLLHSGADVNYLNKEGASPLHSAISIENLEIIKLLLNSGARTDIVLHQSIKHGNFEVLELLLDHGANVNLNDEHGCTGLHFAAEQGYYRVILLLLNRNATVGVVNKEGMSPLHLAARQGSREVVAELVNRGASVNLKNNHGQTALELTTNEDVKNFLRSVGAEETVVVESEESNEPVQPNNDNNDNESKLEREVNRVINQVAAEGRRFFKRF